VLAPPSGNIVMPDGDAIASYQAYGLCKRKLTDLPVTQMLNAAFHFFLLTGVKRTSVRAAQITAYAAGDRHARGVVVTTFRAGKAFAGALELTGKAALVAFINWRVGPVIRHVLIAVIPDVFQCFQVVLNIRVFAVANEASVRQRRVWRFENRSCRTG